MKSLLLVLVVWMAGLLPLAAHDVGVMKLRFEELGDARYQLRYLAPPGSPESQASPVLPERGAWEEEPELPAGLVKLIFTTVDGGPLESGDVVRLPWRRDGVMVEAFWRNGETHRQYFRAGPDGIELRIGELSSGTGGSAEAAGRYVRMGAEHILTGWDHLLFIACLLMLVRGVGPLVLAITSFTVAHSVMLALVSYGWSPLEPTLVEALIALSIAFLASEVLRSGDASVHARPVAVAFGFGLLHGMGLAGALRELGLPAAELPLALGFFNLGVEVGQLVFVAPVLAIAWAWRRWGLGGGKRLIGWSATAAGSLAMFWFFERTIAMFS
ncbi:HupE/UreJ family protein [Luteolibacter marinus]|uniref:HupE/UreJ family protein n=1 Tax=Luteolibacter marinus TaxID=2776705 RepID=UPI0018693E37|nr:HupE/UreJ family protein [Luteolibacter marinus]